MDPGAICCHVRGDGLGWESSKGGRVGRMLMRGKNFIHRRSGQCFGLVSIAKNRFLAHFSLFGKTQQRVGTGSVLILVMIVKEVMKGDVSPVAMFLWNSDFCQCF